MLVHPTPAQAPPKFFVNKITKLKENIGNYRPISYLCSSSKIFEKLILKQIFEIQDEENVDLTGAAQHGLKKKGKRIKIFLEVHFKFLAVDSFKATLPLSRCFFVCVLFWV